MTAIYEPLAVLKNAWESIFWEGFTFAGIISVIAFALSLGSFYISLNSYLVNKYKLRQDVLKAIIDNVGSDKIREIRGKVFGVGGLSREDQLALHSGKSIERNDCKLTLEELLTLIVGYDRLAYQFGNSDIYLTEICLLQIDFIPVLQESTNVIISQKRNDKLRCQPLYANNLPQLFRFYERKAKSIRTKALRRMGLL